MKERNGSSKVHVASSRRQCNTSEPVRQKTPTRTGCIPTKTAPVLHMQAFSN